MDPILQLVERSSGIIDTTLGSMDMPASRHFGGQLTPLNPPPLGCATVDMKWLIDPFRDKPTSISQSEYLSFGARYDNSDGSNRSGYPGNPRYHS